MIALEKAAELGMGLGAWTMLLFAVIVLGGGLFVCIRRAVVVGRAKREAADE